MGNPVVTVKSSKVSDFNGVGLSGVDVLVNPDMDQSHELKSWWDEGESSTIFNSSGSMGVQLVALAVDTLTSPAAPLWPF